MAAALREAFPEYRRRQTGAFRKLVARALGAAVVTGGAVAGSNPVRRTDAAVVSNGAAAAAAAVAAVATANDAAMNAASDPDDDSDISDDSSDDNDDDDDESGSGSEDDDEEEEAAALAAAEAADADNGNAASAAPLRAPVPAPAPAPSSNPLNAALLSAYASAPKEAASNPPAAAPAIPEGEAFAPREAVAAAAARALAAEAAAAAAAASKEAAPVAKAAASNALAPATQPKRQQQQLQRRGSGGGSAKKRARLNAPGGGFARGGGGSRGDGANGPTSALLASNHHHQFLCEPRDISFDDLGGLDPILASLKELVEYPLSHPEVYAWLGVDPPRGLLLHGPPGCGKTALAHAVARRAGVPFLRVAAPEVVAGVSGESEAIIRGLFASAAALAPCVVFIDEIDAIAPRRESAQREMERRIVAQLLTCMDDLASTAQLAREGARKKSEGGEGGEGGEEATPGRDDSSLPSPSSSSVSPSTLAAVSDALRRHVVVIGATNRPDALDPALRRAGRFDREIALPIPTEAGRASILRVLTRKLRLSGTCDVLDLASRTPGYVGADLEALAKEAAASAATRIFSRLDGSDGGNGGGEEGGSAAAAAAAAPVPMEGVVAVAGEEEAKESGGAATAAAPSPSSLSAPASITPPTPSRLGAGPLTHLELASLSIEPADFEAALQRVQPAVRREGFSSPPAVSWADVGALSDLRSELEYAITRPIADPGLYLALGLSAPTGVLLYGPPGCGKTLLARAVAAEARANFISVKGPELLSKYVGESEAAVRRMFARAASAAPCVLFFDELDALAPRRGRGGGSGSGGGSGGGDSGGAAAERVVNQLLTEMDGLASRGAVFLVGATNRPDIIDPALLRPGRLDKALYVPLPDSRGREDIMRRLTRRTPLAPGSDPCVLAASPACEGFSGADLASLVREAGVCAIREAVERADGEGGGAASVVGVAGEAAATTDARQPPPQQQRLVVRDAHFRAALRSVGPSVSKRDVRVYDALRSRLAPKPLLVEEDEEKDEEKEVEGGKSGGGDGK